MKIYNIHAGHNFKVGGSSGYFSETTENRKVTNTVIPPTNLQNQNSAL